MMAGGALAGVMRLWQLSHPGQELSARKSS
jgi:hypothetical protein